MNDSHSCNYKPEITALEVVTDRINTHNFKGCCSLKPRRNSAKCSSVMNFFRCWAHPNFDKLCKVLWAGTNEIEIQLRASEHWEPRVWVSMPLWPYDLSCEFTFPIKAHKILKLQKLLWEWEFTVRSDPWAGLRPLKAGRSQRIAWLECYSIISWCKLLRNFPIMESGGHDP